VPGGCYSTSVHGGGRGSSGHLDSAFPAGLASPPWVEELLASAARPRPTNSFAPYRAAGGFLKAGGPGGLRHPRRRIGWSVGLW